MNALDILNLYSTRGSVACDGEGLTHLQHAWQCARLAQRAGATDALRLAAWLHDLGHLMDPSDPHAASLASGLGHEGLAGNLLGRLFGDAVGMPVQLHVQAKRYLVAVRPGYRERLSAASRRSLAAQGGAMDSTECQTFRSRPRAEEALQLRLWDDLAKLKDWAPSDVPMALLDLEELMNRVAANAGVAPTTGWPKAAFGSGGRSPSSGVLHRPVVAVDFF